MHFIVGEYSPTPEGTRLRGLEVIPLDRKGVLTEYHTSKDSAIRKAQELAAATPGKQYGVFAPITIFETTKPNIIEKTINDQGEVVVKAKEA